MTCCPLALTPQAAQRKLRQASTNVKHWNVQMNRLMHPIEPGGENGESLELSLEWGEGREGERDTSRSREAAED